RVVMAAEDVLEPDLEICDPHHHLWRYPESVYEIGELRADTGAGHRVTSTVFVECGSAYRSDGPDVLRPVGETPYVAGQADGLIAGIVGFADLTHLDVGAALDAHVELGDGLFRGIRHVSAWDASDDIRASHTNPPPGLLGQDDFRRGFAALGERGLRFDAWLYHPQLPELVALARAHPDVPIVLDHLGGPLGIGPYEGKRDDVLTAWRVAMTEVASCPNVSLKLGGIGMPIFGMGFHKQEGGASSEELAEAWGEPIRWCIESFGVDRCMFESNFPVDRASCDYLTLWNAFKRIAADASPAEKASLFRDTARRVYGL
ncbi:MAG TPA: amidohydrolase family protein, partial [Acidimicrobiales bacterium]|nr:amidohydrolase family protein [Acidimicrobiales bacterium]